MLEISQSTFDVGDVNVEQRKECGKTEDAADNTRGDIHNLSKLNHGIYF